MNQRHPTFHTGSGWVIVCPRGIRQTLTALLISLPILACPASSNTNQTPADLTALSLESLMQIEVPQVYAASKVEQKVTAAPASITVITSDDVKKHGYQTLGDVLQLSLIHISEPTRQAEISYAVFCLKKKKQ